MADSPQSKPAARAAADEKQIQQLLAQPIEITDLVQARAEIERIGRLTVLLGATVALRDGETVAINTKYSPTINAVGEAITQRKAALEAWAKANRAEIFGEEQSVELPEGWLRFRKGNRKLFLLARWDEAKVLAKLLSFDVTSMWAKYVRRNPEINKQQLLVDTKEGGVLPEANLRKIGLRVDRGETFEVECRPEIACPDVVTP